MYKSHTNTDTLLVDIGAGVVLEAPPSVNVSERYVNSHPFIEYTGDRVIAGPDASKIARGRSGLDFVSYEVVGRGPGSLYLVREA